jgi:hypothetical protein
MPFSTEEIAGVRARPLVPDRTDTAALEVAWTSAADGLWHQAYVNGLLAGVTARPEDRRLVVAAPVGPAGPAQAVRIEVVAVDAADRWTDFAGQLAGFGPGAGGQVRLAWQAGEYLDPALDSFDLFADGRSGTVDYSEPLNELPLPARPGGLAPWGFGTGGFGVGGFGQSAARYEWTTDALEPGTWRLAVVAIDDAGNRLALAAEVTVVVAPLPRPPEDFRLAAYDDLSRCATLAWTPSPDV